MAIFDNALNPAFDKAVSRSKVRTFEAGIIGVWAACRKWSRQGVSRLRPGLHSALARLGIVDCARLSRSEKPLSTPRNLRPDMRARRMSTRRWIASVGLRGSAINRASLSAIPSQRSTTPGSRTRPSEVRRPPSKAAVSFLRTTAGKLYGKTVSAGVAHRGPADKVELAPNS